MDVRHKSCEQAVELLLTEMLRQGYVKEDGLVSVTIQTENNSAQEKMLGKIRASVDTLLDSHHSTASADVFAVSREVRDSAHDYNLSPAKYLAITQLQEVDPTASYEQCAEHSISEIMKKMAQMPAMLQRRTAPEKMRAISRIRRVWIIMGMRTGKNITDRYIHITDHGVNSSVLW